MRDHTVTQRLTVGGGELRDVYANLLHDTRGMRPEQATAREAWFTSLPWESKEEDLFELEMLLKGIACFGNPRNHLGAARPVAETGQDFSSDLQLIRKTSERTITVVRSLLGDQDRDVDFSQYLESLVPEDAEPRQLGKDQLTQDTPIEALWVLRNAFTGYVDVIDGLLRGGGISHRIYHGMHGTLTREIGRNTFFNPLVSLEFRSEFDRIQSPDVLEALETVSSDASHRVTALTFLAIFRALRYLELTDRYAASPELVDLCPVILAVFRSDMRVLTRYLTRAARGAMADGLERELLLVDAIEVKEHFATLEKISDDLLSLRRSFESNGEALRLEVLRVFSIELPSPELDIPSKDRAAQTVVGTATLRAALHHAVLGLCRELSPEAPAPALITTAAGKRAASKRLRREVWMFTQILRAFLSKAQQQGDDPNRWTGAASFRFVAEFLNHFRSIGYQLVRISDYENLDEFLGAIEALRDVNFLHEGARRQAIEECTELFIYMDQLFAQISRRAELKKVPFDRQAATETLKLYLRTS
ncbi:MAG: hypothetical protein JRH11_21180 [Deltaproteobacteria bacterium]|nr:hypothetical protein [Deltaproteobacteria bacterium]